jgi:hypothetical protein
VKYWCQIVGTPETSKPLLDAIFAAAHVQRELWNKLCAAHDQVRQQLDEARQQGTLTRELIRERYRELAARHSSSTLYQITAAHTECSDLKWPILDRFLTALDRYLKSGQQWRPLGEQHHAPRARAGITRINLPYVNRSGGHPVQWLFRDAPRARVQVRAVPAAAYADERAESVRLRATRGRFRIPGTELDVPLLIKLHRPLPDGCVIKAISLCGKLERPFGWHWSLAITIEDAAGWCRPALPSDLAAALDIGWRRFPDYIRVGFITDSLGRSFEIRLPERLESQRVRKHNRYFAANQIPRRLPASAGEVIDFVRERDYRLEECKALLADMAARDPQLAACLPGKNALRLMRQRGLYDLRRRMQLAGLGVVTNILDAWAAEDRRWHGRITEARERLLRVRNAQYRKVAARLAETYGTLIYEGDFNLTTVASPEVGEPDYWAKKRAQFQRHLSAPSILRQYILEAFRRRARTLVPRNAAHSSRQCAHCGAPIEPRTDLVVTCTAGHTCDTDLNTTRLFLAGYLAEQGERVPVLGAAKPVDRQQIEAWLVPFSARYETADGMGPTGSLLGHGCSTGTPAAL